MASAGVGVRLMSAPAEEFNIAGVLNPVFDPLVCSNVLGIVVTLTGRERYCTDANMWI